MRRLEKGGAQGDFWTEGRQDEQGRWQRERFWIEGSEGDGTRGDFLTARPRDKRGRRQRERFRVAEQRRSQERWQRERFLDGGATGRTGPLATRAIFGLRSVGDERGHAAPPMAGKQRPPWQVSKKGGDPEVAALCSVSLDVLLAPARLASARQRGGVCVFARRHIGTPARWRLRPCAPLRVCALTSRRRRAARP